MLWTDVDFDTMSWHDNPIHGFCFDKDFKFYLDIDYIFRWVKTKNGKHFKFWISPCTLVFENVYDFKMEEDNPSDLVILAVERDNAKVPRNVAFIKKDTEYDWLIETLHGEMTFTSVGFKQYVRSQQVLIGNQIIELSKRGGVSFDTTISK
jgi:hypothetical protein